MLCELSNLGVIGGRRDLRSSVEDHVDANGAWVAERWFLWCPFGSAPISISVLIIA